MACRLAGAKPLSEPVMEYCQLETNFSEILIEIVKFSFFQEHAFEDVVWRMAAILSRAQCDKAIIEVCFQIIDR